MLLLSTIFRHEWRQFLRQRWMQASFLLFSLIALAAILAGNRTAHMRFAQSDSIRQAYQDDFRAQLGRFADTLTQKGQAGARTAGMPAMINYRLPQTVIKDPAPAAALSLGLMDVQPWHLQVRSTRSFSDETQVPVSNPMELFSGNFDLAFVIIYLLPLLVLVITCSAYAAEKEAGTSPLLSIQAGDAEKVVRLRLLFRFLLSGALLSLLNAWDFVLAERRMPYTMSILCWWMLLNWLYLLFWFALAYFVVSFKKNATVTALWQTAAWVLLLVVAPSMVNSFVQARHPLPMKDEIAAYRRHQGEEIWNMPPAVLCDSFNLYNPSYLASANLSKDTVRLSDRSIAGYYDLLERRMKRVLEPYEKGIEQRNARSLAWLAWDPALLLGSHLDRLANNHLDSYQDFTRQSEVFQKQWQAFLYRFHLPGKHLEKADFPTFPVFRYEPAKTPPGEYGQAALSLLGLSLLLMGAGAVTARNRRKEQRS